MSFELEALINEDNPYCAYCQSYCNIQNTYSAADLIIGMLFSCIVCNNEFKIVTYSTGDQILVTSFSCDDLYVNYKKWDNNTFTIRRRCNQNLLDLPPNMSLSNEDFKNKNLLHKKLSTYLLFL